MILSPKLRKNGARATNARFQETRWPMVLKACAGSSEALEDLARTYWPAVYAFLRRKGFAPPEAEDITQRTLIRLLEKGHLPPVSSAKGRFRNFLCACAINEASHFRKEGSAEKRGGGDCVISLDALEAEKHYQALAAMELPIEQVYDRAWSQVVVSRALDGLKSEYDRLGKRNVCETMIPLLKDGTKRGDHRLIAEKLGMTEGNARVTLSRFKKDFINHMRNEVAETVDDPDELNAELQHLLSAWISAPP